LARRLRCGMRHINYLDNLLPYLNHTIKGIDNLSLNLYNEIMKKPQSDFGKYVSNLRNKNNLNGTETAEKAGISQSSLSGWEQGKVAPDFEHLVALMRSLNLKWPDTLEFLTVALNSFEGRMAFPINDGILPKNLLINLLASYMAADCGKEDRAKQYEIVSKNIDAIKSHLETIKEKLLESHRIGIKTTIWVSPLPPPINNAS